MCLGGTQGPLDLGLLTCLGVMVSRTIGVYAKGCWEGCGKGVLGGVWQGCAGRDVARVCWEGCGKGVARVWQEWCKRVGDNNNNLCTYTCTPYLLPFNYINTEHFPKTSCGIVCKTKTTHNKYTVGWLDTWNHFVCGVFRGGLA